MQNRYWVKPIQLPPWRWLSTVLIEFDRNIEMWISFAPWPIVDPPRVVGECTRPLYSVEYCVGRDEITDLYTRKIKHYSVSLLYLHIYNLYCLHTVHRGESLALQRLWSPSAAMPCVFFAYFKVLQERNLVQNMVRKTPFRNSAKWGTHWFLTKNGKVLGFSDLWQQIWLNTARWKH